MFLSGNLRYLRKKAKVTRQSIADYLGISAKNYGHYETGHAQPPLLTAYHLSKYFGKSLTTLIEKDIAGEPPSKFNTKDYRVRTPETETRGSGTGAYQSQ